MKKVIEKSPVHGRVKQYCFTLHAEGMSFDSLLNAAGGYGMGSAGFARRPGTKTQYYGTPIIKGTPADDPD